MNSSPEVVETTASIVREEFGATELRRSSETQSSALEAQARAAVQARYIIAQNNRRNWSNVRRTLLDECSRPRFAEAARYSKPVGGQRIEGLSIRFAESALRLVGNVFPETIVVFDDADKLIMRVMLTDLESNITYSKDVLIPKTVERRNLKDGEKPLRTRTNSYGKAVYILPATDDDIENKKNAVESKVLRNHLLRVLPADIKEECEEKIANVIRQRIAEDPDAERKRIEDAFAKLKIMPSDLETYIGHSTARANPMELAELRAVYVTVRDNEATWEQCVAQKTGKTKAKDENTELKKKIAAEQQKLRKGNGKAQQDDDGQATGS